MKPILCLLLTCLLFFSCKKQDPETRGLLPASGYEAIDPAYLKNVQAYLKKNMGDAEYQALDWNRALLSREEAGWYLRLGYGGESMAQRFLLVASDAVGNVADAREVRITRDPFINCVFNGRVEMKDLQGRIIASNSILNGYAISDRIRQPGAVAENNATTVFIVPADAPAQVLPEVIVVGYYGGAGGSISFGDYILLSGLSGGGISGSGSSGNAGSSSGGSGSAGAGNSGTIAGAYSLLRPAILPGSRGTRVVSDPPTIIAIETSYSKPGINLAAYLKCFGSIPDAGAAYAVSLFVDLPVNDDPTQVFNQATGAVGHSFLGLTKTGSGQSLTQYFGFASTQPFSAITGTVTSGKIVDNGTHKYNASLSIPVNALQFGLAMNAISNLSGSDYDLNNFNCVDFALSVINSFRPTAPLIPAAVRMPAGALSIDTPQGLYITLEHIHLAGGAAVTGSIWNAGSSHGPCN